MKFITVFIAQNLVDAEMVKDAIIDHGIEAIVINQNMGTLWPHVDATRVQVQVNLENEEQALQILHELKP